MRDLVLAFGPSTDDTILRSRRRLLNHLGNRDAEKAVQEMDRHLKRVHKMWLTGAYEGSRTRA
jgi:DNA-binding FadR family transcriptional regulator